MKTMTLPLAVAAFLTGPAHAVQAPIGAAVPAFDRLGETAASNDPEGALRCLYEGLCPESTSPEENPVSALGTDGPPSSPWTPAIPEAPSLTADIPAPAVESGGVTPGAPARDILSGVKNGARAGATLGFYGVLSPAIHLLSEGFGRGMSGYYDGPRKGNAHPGLYTAAGWALAAVLYVPALIVGAVGGAVGAVVGAGAELVSPGSPSRWDVERAVFD